jgi:hypothetical protein
MNDGRQLARRVTVVSLNREVGRHRMASWTASAERGRPATPRRPGAAWVDARCAARLRVGELVVLGVIVRASSEGVELRTGLLVEEGERGSLEIERFGVTAPVRVSAVRIASGRRRPRVRLTFALRRRGSVRRAVAGLLRGLACRPR